MSKTNNNNPTKKEIQEYKNSKSVYANSIETYMSTSSGYISVFGKVHYDDHEDGKLAIQNIQKNIELWEQILLQRGYKLTRKLDEYKEEDRKTRMESKTLKSNGADKK